MHRHLLASQAAVLAAVLSLGASPAGGDQPNPPPRNRAAAQQSVSDWPGWASIGPSPGSTRFVSPSGSDETGTGSAALPFRSIQAAVNSANPGDEVSIAAGEYAGDVRIREPNITLRGSYGANKPHIIVPNQTESTHEIALEIDPDADGTRVIGLNVEGGSYYAVSCETKWDWGDPADRSGATGLVIAYNDLHHSGRDAVKIKPNCDDVLLANNTIHHTGQRDDSNAEGIDNVNGDRMTVLDNHLYDIATTGLYFKGGAIDARVERNLIERVGRGTSPDSVGAGILVGFDTDTDFFDRSQNPEMYEALRARVVNNIIDETTMTGIGVYAAKDSLVAHNTIRNCCRDYHAGVAFGITLQSWMTDGLRPPSRNVTVWGNLIGIRSARGEDYGSAIRYSFEPELGGLSAYDGMPIMDYNVYSAAAPPVLFSDGRPGSEYDAAGVPGWFNHTGADGHSQAKPVVLSANWVPDLQVPVVPQGYSLTNDFYGQARSATPIAGAVERDPPADVDPPPTDPPGGQVPPPGKARQTVIGVPKSLIVKHSAPLPRYTRQGVALRWKSLTKRLCRTGVHKVSARGRPGICRVRATAPATTVLLPFKARYQIKIRKRHHRS